MTMQAIHITQAGGPEVLQMRQTDRPVPGQGEVLIRVHASGVNRPDVLQRKGHYPAPAGASPIPGLEVAGHIVSGDEQALTAAGWQVGDAVCALVAGGGYAQYCVAPVAQCLPIPKGWSMIEAAGLPETAFTVWSNVFDRGGLQPGEVLLVQGGSSGIGVMAIQMAKAHGARVIVTAGSAQKCGACVQLGADAAINYRETPFETEVLKLTAQRGADVILDMVAGPYVAREIQALADDGRLVIIAVQGGVAAEIDAGQVLRRRLTITGSTLRARPVAFKAEIAASLRRHAWPWFESGLVKPVVHRVFEAEAASLAHACMGEGSHIGKIVLRWPGAEGASVEENA